MADNVVKFRKVEKKPEKKAPAGKPPGKAPQWPGWLPWAVIVGVSVAFVAVQQSGLFCG